MAEPLPSTTPTGDTHDPSPSNETSPTFHPFPKLPTEIRLAIWKHACFPRSEVDHGIQYVTVNIAHEDGEENDILRDDNLERLDDDFLTDEDDNGFVTLTAQKRPGDKPTDMQRSSSRPSASACLWDYGLFTACRESKLAVSEHYDLKGWLELRDPSKSPTDMSEAWYDKDFLSTLVPHKSDEKWCPMVIPRLDIFCIDMSQVQAIPKSLCRMKLLTPFLSARTFTIKESWNIALKYDRSWNTKLRPQDYRLRRENTPRGLLANWLHALKYDVCSEPSLWIIDDSVSWVAKGKQTYTPVYRDYDGEYVQIDWEDTRRDGGKGDVARLFGCLSDILDHRGGFPAMGTKKIVKLLVRKDNQIPWDSDEELEFSDGEYSWNEDRDSDQSTDISSDEDY